MSDPPPASLPPEGARCALHPDLAAEHTCVRCGNYMCQACASSADSHVCSSCAARLDLNEPFPFSRERFGLQGLLEFSLTRWKENWQLLAAVFGGAVVLIYGSSELLRFVYELAVGPEPDTFEGLQTYPGYLALQLSLSVLQLALMQALTGLCLDLLQRRPYGVRESLARLRALPAALLQLLLTYTAIALVAGGGVFAFMLVLNASGMLEALIAVLAYALVLAPVLAWVTVGLSFCWIALAEDPELSGIDAIVLSWRAVAGKRAAVIGITLVAQLIVLAGLLLCCVGGLASVPIATLLYCGTYLALLRK